MNGGSSEYDIFLSYARVDNRENDRYVERLAEEMTSLYRLRTGRQLRIFLDRQEITTSQMWEREIHAALRRSSIMIAVLSPAYFRSSWCGREWDGFIAASRDRSITYGITPYLKLIFPVKLQEWAGADRSRGAIRRVREAEALQYADFAGVSPGTGQFTALVTRLLGDVTEALTRLAEVTPGYVQATASAESPMITTRRARDHHQFTHVLADAINVTIIGVTNENLASFLDEALEIKRRRLGAGAFWESLRIVFLREDLLSLVSDQLDTQWASPDEIVRERKLRAKAGKRAVVSFLIRQNQPDRWSLHEYEYFLPFLGALFDMPDGTNLVQITMARPRHRFSDAIYFEFVDPADHYFANAFNDIVSDSRDGNEVVLVGTPGTTQLAFHVNGARFRRGALMGGETTRDWLPAVVVVTWSTRNGVAVPMLQVRTKGNAAQYIHHLSHIGGYVDKGDLISVSQEVEWSTGSPHLLPAVAAVNAARRELHDQLDVTTIGDGLQFFGTCRFSNHDRENLFFYLFTLRLPETHQPPEGSEVRGWKIGDLVSLHKYQLLRKAEGLLRRDDLSAGHRVAAARILAAQLTLHGERGLGRQLVRAAERPPGRLADQLHRATAQPAVHWRLAGQETALAGLAEIHYREFFSVMLPLYAQVGIADAAGAIDQHESFEGAGEALDTLREAYQDDDLLSSLPFEV
jgi:TIR domain